MVFRENVVIIIDLSKAFRSFRALGWDFISVVLHCFWILIKKEKLDFFFINLIFQLARSSILYTGSEGFFIHILINRGRNNQIRAQFVIQYVTFRFLWIEKIFNFRCFQIGGRKKKSQFVSLLIQLNLSDSDLIKRIEQIHEFNEHP